MDDIYLYYVDLPRNVSEMVVPCADGYTIYIDIKLSHAEKVEAYHHAMEHIRNDDWSRDDADHIERERHETSE